MFGLSDKVLDAIRKALSRFPEVEEAVLFGSRALGNEKRGSDIDLALKGSRINSRTIAKVSSLLENEVSSPYFFDVIDYHSITNPDLKDHVDRNGMPFYRRP